MQLKHAQRREFRPSITPGISFSLYPRTKGPGHDRVLNARTFSEAKCRLSRKIQEDLVLKFLTLSYHKWPGSKALLWKTAPPALPHTSLFPLSLVLNPGWGRQMSFASCLPAIKLFSFLKSQCHSTGLKASAIVLASVCIRQWALAR